MGTFWLLLGCMFLSACTVWSTEKRAWSWTGFACSVGALLLGGLGLYGVASSGMRDFAGNFTFPCVTMTFTVGGVLLVLASTAALAAMVAESRAPARVPSGVPTCSIAAVVFLAAAAFAHADFVGF